MNIAVVGSGVVGCLSALMLKHCGAKVSLLTASQSGNEDTCSYAAGGMLSPIAEAVYGNESIAHGGWDSVERWAAILQTLDEPFLMGRTGSLVFAAPSSQVELSEWAKRLTQRFSDGPWEFVKGVDIRALEPGLDGCANGLIHLKNEGFVDSRGVLGSLSRALEREGVEVQYGTRVDRVDHGTIQIGLKTIHYDWVIDCRGLGAQSDLKELRGVRGEALIVNAPDVSFNRPIRVLHPRYPIYLVPRDKGLYYVGATVVESESLSPISVHSLLEILSGLYQFHPGFRYGQVVETLAQARPAYDDHEPRIVCERRLIRVNGLFRHGFLLGPIVAQSVADLVYGRSVDPRVESWVIPPPPMQPVDRESIHGKNAYSSQWEGAYDRRGNDCG